jgi:hypothetical protein
MKKDLNKTDSCVRADKRLSDMFPIANDFKQGDASTPLLLTFALEYATNP